jgi:CelD/BcsL family acetyltransferase involved in cellulose biosynthesis
LNGRVAKVRELSSADVTAWQELGRDAIEPNPLLEPDCLVPAARLLPNGAEISLAIAEEDGKFYGCFPIERARGGGDRMPLTLIERLLPTYTTQVRRNRYDLTPLLRPERRDEAMIALLRAIHDAHLARAPMLLRFEALNADGEIDASMRRAANELHLPLYVAESWTRPVAYRRDDGEYEQGSDAKRKNIRELHRKQRRLGQLLGGEVCLVDRSDDPMAIDELFALERSGYKFATGVATESWSGEAEWLRAMCDEFRKSGRLVVCTLEAGGTTAALVIMLRGGDRLLGLQRAYDEQLKQYSPGTLLDLLFFDHVHRMEGIRMQDSCTAASNQRSVRLFDDSRPVITAVIAVGGRWDRMLLVAYGYLRDRLRPRERLLLLMAEHQWIDRLARRNAARVAPSRPKRPDLN